MESTTFNTGRLIWITAITGLCITLVAFQKQETRPMPPSINTDTIPKKKELKIRDLDEALEGLDEVNITVDLGDLHKELAKIKPEVEKAIASAGAEVAKSLKDIDVAAISKEVNEAIEKIDCEKINREVKAAIEEVDWDKIKKELAEVKELKLDKIHVDMEKVDAELKKIQPELNKKLAGVKVEIEKAKKEFREYKEFVDGLNQDNLINKKEEYIIKHRNGELIINGKVQPESVYNKYRDFLEKHKTLTIERSDDNFSINNE
ncbi:MAG: hypothetical protein JSS70_17380 [Bacteroidetes bacterium]|nr:hypothetical protein [Bacteroidota bacterium]